MLDRFFDEALKDSVAAKGTALLDSGKHKEGIEELKRASKDNPDNWYVWFVLGSGLRIRSETREEGISALKRAAELENVDTFYSNTASISAVGAMRRLEEDTAIIRALKSEGTPAKSGSKCKRCGWEDITTYKFGWRNWVCLDCVYDLMRESQR
ncbi:MAG: tetratricopeptide repeat protein [Candidatus Thorarchaeota archaeon]